MIRWLAGILLVLLLFPAAPSRGSQAELADLQAHYKAPSRETSGVGIPVRIRSGEQAGRQVGKVYGVFDQDYASLAEALTEPANWCRIVFLTPNIKTCVHGRQEAGKFLTFYAGRKFYQAPEEAYQLHYRFQIEAARDDYLSIALTAPEGPLGTEDYRLTLEAMPTDGGTFAMLSFAYRPGTLSSLLRKGYLATIGRDKVGFTVTGRTEEGDPVYVQGVRGVVERNAMRYYLAVKAFMDTLDRPPEKRFEARLQAWFALTDQYARQLRELDREEYLENKKRERRNQERLQQEQDRKTGDGNR